MTDVLFIVGAFAVLISLSALAISPRLGVLLVLLFRPVIDTTYATVVVGELSLSRIFSASVVALVLMHMVSARGSAHFRHMPLRWWWLVFTAYTLVFSVHIMLVESMLSGVEVGLRYLNGIVGAFMLQAWFSRDRELRRLLLVIIAAGLFPIAVGLFQVATGVQWKLQEANQGLERYIGLYHDAAILRFYMLQTLLAIAAYALVAGRGWLLRSAAVGLAPAAALVMYYAFSKSAVVIVAAWTVIWVVLRRDLRAALAVAVVGLVTLAVFEEQINVQIGLLFEREVAAVAGEADYRRSFAGRWFGWQEMFERWSDASDLQKVFGVGERATYAHNDYLQMLFHGGLVGLALYVAFLAAIGLSLLRVLRRRAAPMTVIAIMAFALWLVDTIGLVPSAYPPHHWLVWGLIGIALRRHRDARRRRPRPESGLAAVPAGGQLAAAQHQ